MKGFKKVLCLGLLLGVSTSAFSDTHYVRAGWTNPLYPYTNWITASTSILSAAGATVNGDTIIVSNGTYQHYAQIGAANSITIRSVNGPDVTTVDGQSQHRDFYFGGANFVLDGFTITHGGNAEFGGGVYGAGSGLITNCVIVDNWSSNHGGGLYFVGAATVLNCRITGNVASNPALTVAGGGGFYMPGGMVSHCIVQSNRAYFAGGGYVYADAVIRNCLFTYNAATGSDGGGLYAYLGNEVDACTFTSNRAASSCGGLLFGNGMARNCIFYGNEAPASPNYTVTTDVTYSCVSPRYGWQETCVDGPPGFVDVGAGEQRFSSLKLKGHG